MNRMLKNCPWLIATLLLTMLITTSGSYASSELKKIYSTSIIIDQLSNWHYSKKQLNNEISSQLFDKYIEKVDPRKQFFLEKDINEFQSFRYLLDNLLKKADLEISKKIYLRYVERHKHLLEQSLKDWPKIIDDMDFTRNETLQIDRKNEHPPKTPKESMMLWKKHLKNSVLNLDISGKKQDKIKEILKRRLTFQLANLNKTTDDDIFEVFMNSLTELYDPHTNFFSPQVTENFNINMSLSLQGIGAVLEESESNIKVVRLVPGGPADKQNELKPNDIIIGVGQGKTGEIIDIVGWRLNDVVQIIRGQPKTIVRLEITRGKASSKKHHFVEISRDIVKLEDQSAQKAVISLPNNNDTVKIGVINIPTFYMDFDAYNRGDKNYKSTTSDVARLLSELDNEDVSGVIIDLRNNGGGSLHEANNLIGLFIEQGPTVQIKTNTNNIIAQGKALKSNFYSKPIIVLINRLSASASEIFAAAIQDYQRGLIVGSQSYGKGTVQTIKALPYGNLKITESKFYRVSGESTQHRGVIPDITFPEIYDKENIGESSLEYALAWDKIPKIQHQKHFDVEDILSTLTEIHKKRSTSTPDFTYIQAQQKLLDTKETVISLNKKQRIANKNKLEKDLLYIENVRRRAKTLKVVSSFDELEELEEARKEKNDRKIDTENDAFLLESAKILVDFKQEVINKCLRTTKITPPNSKCALAYLAKK
jgi:carboxyl-terminal processing protease